ncbi:DEAD/DEAH box helicase, partial [Halogeometricum borinquense]
SRDGVVDLLDATFFAHQSPDVNRARLVDSVVEELAEMEMLDDGDGNGRKDRLTATELGSAVSRQYVTPVTGARLVEGVQTAARMADENVTELTALEIICDTPDMHGTYLGNRERAAMYRFASTHAAEFTTDLGAAENFEEWLCAVKLARIFADWTAGESVEAIVENYRIGPGDLEARLERVEWLLGAADAIADVVNADLPVFREVRDRL